jgi:hypothetical protein
MQSSVLLGNDFWATCLGEFHQLLVEYVSWDVLVPKNEVIRYLGRARRGT